MFTSRSRLTATLLGAVLAGCASLPPDRGRGEVAALLQAQGLDTVGIAHPGEPTPLHEPAGDTPLTLEAAVHLALVNNPELRARFAELGFAAADVYDAGRLGNPALSLSYLFAERGSAEDEKSVGLTMSFTELILLPARKRLADAEFVRVQRTVAGAVQQVAADVAYAWYGLAGFTEVAAMQQEIAATARLSADLAARYHDAGNLGPGDLAEIRAAAAGASLDALQAEQEVAAARADLRQALGLSLRTANWRITAGLPAPSTAAPDSAQLVADADRARLDLAAARQAVAVRADALGVSRRFRYLGRLEFGPKWESNDDGMRSFGPTLVAELPIFNQGAGRIARAEAGLALEEARLAALEVEIVTGIDRAAAAVTNADARFRQYRGELIPARREIVARRQEAVNFMLEGPFALLAAKQDEYGACRAALQALQDYWLARVDLARAAGLPPPAVDAVEAEIVSAASLIETRSGAADHAPGAAAAHEHALMPDSQSSQPLDATPAPDASNEHQHGDPR